MALGIGNVYNVYKACPEEVHNPLMKTIQFGIIFDVR